MIDRTMIRLSAHEGQHAIAEALQRSLLSRPVEPDHVQVAVRYLPAGRQTEVGGDWYDAFLGPDGELVLVVGDVTGHDQHAAARMGQVRNLLRGVYYTLRATPAAAMTALDDACAGLAVGDYATAVLARVEQHEQDRARGLRTLRWTNAGHPPPVLIDGAGHARLLDTAPEPLLGLASGARADHAIELEPGATVVFYTDGLVEARDESLTTRLEWLVGLLLDAHHFDAERLCDHILRSVSPSGDDIVLLVLRVHPEDKPRPPEAGPSVLPGSEQGGADELDDQGG
jgi:serine phosphatase RsbU (regulator of sigma subunit)